LLITLEMNTKYPNLDYYLLGGAEQRALADDKLLEEWEKR